MLCLLVFLLKSKEVLGHFALPLAGVCATIIKDQNKFCLKKI